MSKRKLRPVADENWRVIAPKPDLTSLGLQPPADPRQNEPNDHTIFQLPDGSWHLWACVRNTRIGRLLVHWQAESLDQAPWTLTGEVIRCDRNAGESLVVWKNQDFLQSPYVVTDGAQWYMSYGGYATGMTPDGKPTVSYDAMENQICLMTSPDGRSWERISDEWGHSRLFAGPGAARDQFITKFGDTWYIYYCGHHNRDVNCEGIYVRTSADLLHWSDWEIAHFDQVTYPKKKQCESPVVVERGGYFYMLRTGGHAAGTLVLRSEDPKEFGVGIATHKHVCGLPTVAPEIVVDEDGQEYITTIRPGTGPEGGGLAICGLSWVDDE